eukprot:SAG22_NODE_38_length_26325_cov_107.302067_4_plen_92_part_00
MTKEVLSNLHRMLANIHITIGEAAGTTLLPLPPDEGSALMDEKERIYQLETSIITWTRQIKDILKSDSEEVSWTEALPLPSCCASSTVVLI